MGYVFEHKDTIILYKLKLYSIFLSLKYKYMEKVTIYLKNGMVKQCDDKSVTSVSGNFLIVTTKKTDEDDKGEHLIINTTEVFDLGEVERLVKIRDTVKFDLSDGSEK